MADKEVIFLEGLEANLPTTGIIDGAIYVCTDSGKTYLGTSSTTMIPLNIVEASSNNGKIKINGTDVNVYTHPGSGTNPHGTTKSDVGLGNVGNFKAVSTVANQGLTDTEKSNARANIGAGTSNLTIGTTSTTAAAGNHTHATSIATSTGTSQITLQAGGKYSITAGGTTYIFTMPSDNNTNQTVKGAGTAFGANDAIDIVAGSNVTVTPDTTNKKITIAATDTTYSEATTSVAGLMSASDKTKLNGIATGAEVNQNAFSNVKVGTTTVAADAKTDTLELVAGNNITLTPDATNDKITIASSYTDTNQTVKVGSSTFGANAAVAIAAGSNVTVTPDTTNNTITIASSYTDTNQKVKVGSTTFGNNDVVEIAAGANVTVSPDSTNKKITIAATDTTYSAGTGLSLSGTTFNHSNSVTSGTAGTSTDTSGSTLAVPYVSYDSQGHITSSGTHTHTVNGFLPSTGGTITGDLTRKDTRIDASKADNNVTTTLYPTTFNVTDASNRIITRKEAIVESNGNISAFWYCRNYDTSGTMVAQKGIKITVNKAGTATYVVSDGANFRSAIGAGTSNLTLGTTSTTAAAGNHTHTLSLASGGTSTVNLTANTAYTLTAGGSTLVFKTPADGNTDAKQKITTATTTKAYITGVTATNYSSGTAYEGLADTGVYLTTTAGELAATNFVGKHSGYTLAAACAKGVDTSIAAGTTSANLPTSAAVEARLGSFLAKSGGTMTGALTLSGAPTADLHAATKKYVDDSLLALPEPMIFKGSLGTSGTITDLPTASASNEGFTYKVITAGTYASQTAKVGDTFISDGSAWVLIPSGDEPSGTVTSITLKATSPIAIDSTAAITTSGTRTLSHANSGVTAGTYRSVTVNATGHVTAGTNPTTLSGYGITDAKIASGVITLGSNTITPLTSSSTLNAAKLSGAIPTTVTQTNWDAAYTHSTSTHARTDATAVTSSTTNGNIKINGTETTVYTHPSENHVPSGGSSGQFLGWDSSGKAKWVNNPNSNTQWSGEAYCSTAAGTAAKTATMPGFALATNQVIILKLDTTSTVASATLNVNGTGAKTVRIGGAATTTSNFVAGYWWAQYDGTYWNLTRLYFTDTNTHRPIQMNGTEILGNNTTALNLKAGSNVSLTNSSGTVTIAATDTTYSAGTGISLSGTTFSNSGVRSVTQDSTDGHKLTVNTGGTTATITIPDNDTKVTSSANHYTPATVSGQDKSASASGATAAWSIDVVKGVTLNTDGKGHVTGITVTSGKIPANPNTNQTVKVGTTTFGANDAVAIAAGSNVTVTPDTTNKKITIAATDTTYSVGTTTVPNVTSVGSAPTLGTAISADDITKFEVNSTNACLEIAFTSRSIPNMTSVGSAPTLGTAITVVNSVTAN